MLNEMKKRRLCADMTQKQLAKAVGTHWRNVQNWERDPMAAKAGNLKKVAGVLGCTVDDLLG